MRACYNLKIVPYILRLKTRKWSLFLQILLVLLLVFIELGDLSPAYCQDSSDFEFFPYESCLVLEVEKIEQTGKVPVISATVRDVLRGKHFVRNPISFCIQDREEREGGSAMGAAFRVGKTIVMAFNSNPPNRFRKHLEVYNQTFPLGMEAYKKEDTDKLRNRLARINFPFRACVDATIIKNKFVKKGCKACHPGRIDLEVKINEVYLADSQTEAEKQGVPDEKTVPKTFHTNLQAGQIIRTFFYEDNPRQLKKGQRFIWSFNPVYHDEKDPEKIFLGLNGGILEPLESLSESSAQKDLKELNKQISQYLESTHKHMQEFVEKRWTKEQIELYTSKPELRYIPRTPGLVVTEGTILSGQLYKDAQDKLGKVLWFSGLIEGKPCGEYQLQVHKEGRNFWILESGYFNADSTAITEDQFYKKYFKDMLTKCGITYMRVNNSGENKKMMPGGTGIILERDSDNRIGGIRCALQNGEELTAKVDANLELSEFQIDSNESGIWGEAYRNRQQNMQKVWDETLKYEKW